MNEEKKKKKKNETTILAEQDGVCALQLTTYCNWNALELVAGSRSRRERMSAEETRRGMKDEVEERSHSCFGVTNAYS